MSLSAQQCQDQTPGKSLSQKRDCNDLGKDKQSAYKDGHSCNRVMAFEIKTQTQKGNKRYDSVNQRELRAEKTNIRNLA